MLKAMKQWMKPMKPNLDELLKRAKAHVDAMSREELDAMLKRQGESWAKSEAQWAKDFREGKCERD